MHDHDRPRLQIPNQLAAAARPVPEAPASPPRPSRVDPATLAQIRNVNLELGQLQAQAQALVAQRSLVLTKALVRLGCDADGLDLAVMAPDGTLTYQAAPSPVSPEVYAALEGDRAAREALAHPDSGK